MKKRMFYIINLDKNRMLAIGVLFIGFLTVSFATGIRFGRSQVAVVAGSDDGAMRNNPDGMEKDLEESGNVSNSEESESKDLGKSIYSLDEKERPNIEKDLASPVLYDSKYDDVGESKARKSSYDSSKSLDSESKREQSAKVVREKKERAKKKSAERETRKKVENNRNKDKAPTKRVEPKEERVVDKRSEKTTPKKTDNIKIAESTTETKNKSKKNRKAPLLDLTNETKMSNVSEKQRHIHAFQVGAFESREAAKRMAETLNKNGFRAHILSGGGKHTVRVGTAENQLDGQELEKKLRNKNFSPLRIYE